MREVLFCVSGPSGVGKGTLVRELIRTDPSLALSVSCTTRAPREGEENGREYFFLTHEEFLKGVERGDFIEYDEHFGNYYGTLKSYVDGKLAEGKSVVLEIDVVGTLAVKQVRSDCVTVFIAPPSEETLEKRLQGRGSESEEQLMMRHERVAFEYKQSQQYDYIVVNDDFEEAVEALRKIVKFEQEREV